MAFIAPVWDAGFAENRTHGATAQLAELEQVVALCHRRRTAVDVGAHIGTWTRPLAARFARVLAFEPQPENYGCLEQNVNAAVGVELHQFALGAGRAQCSLKQHEGGNSGCWRVVNGSGVELRQLDSFDLEDVDLIKIDAEGYEGHVLDGASQTLLAASPVIVFEDNGIGPKLFSDAWIDPKDILAAHGYHHARRIFKDEVWIRR